MEPIRTRYADDLDGLGGLDDFLDELEGLDDPDELLAVVADRECRRTLAVLRDAPRTVTSLDALASDGRIGRSGRADGLAAATRLHHQTLPRLDDAGLLEYDADARTVRYRQHSSVRTLLEAVESGGR